MRRLILLSLTLFACVCVGAQEPMSTIEPAQSNPIKQWLAHFTSLDVDAPINLTLIEIGENDEPYIIYDTKGCYTSKFSAETEKSALKIRERNELKRETVTDVTIYYNTLSEIRISKAVTVCKNTLDSPLLDIIISSGASFVATIDVKDLMIDITGKCSVKIDGNALYQTANVSTAEYNAINLATTSTTITSSHNAVAYVDATQRLEGKTAMGGEIFYNSYPEIFRSFIPVFGGEISKYK